MVRGFLNIYPTPALAIVLHRGCLTLRLNRINRVFSLAEVHPTFGRQRFNGKRIIVQSDDRDFYLDSSTSRWLSFCVGRLSCGYSFVMVANCSLERLDVDFKTYQVTPSVQGGVVSEPL